MNYLKSFLRVFSSNALVSILGIISGLYLPIYLTNEGYGYWHYYLLFYSYAQLILVGVFDGLFIRNAGTSYDEVDKTSYSSVLYAVVIYLTFVLAVAFIGISMYNPDDQILKKVWFFIAIGSYAQCINCYFVVVNQSTERFGLYAISNTFEKVLLILGLLVTSLVDKTLLFLPIYLSILAKVLSIGFNIAYNKKIVFSMPQFNKALIAEIKENIKAGLPITIYGIITVLTTSFGKLYIVFVEGIIDLANYSFAHSSISMLSQAVLASSLVAFPAIRKFDSSKHQMILVRGESAINIVSPLILYCYFPLVFLINNLIPKYSSAVTIIGVFILIIPFQFKINMLYANIFKARRKETSMTIIAVITYVTSILITMLLYWISSRMLSLAIALVFTYFTWYQLMRSILKIKVPQNILSISTYICMLAYVFIVMKFEFTKGFIVYGIAVLLYYIVNYKTVLSKFSKIKNLISRSEGSKI